MVKYNSVNFIDYSELEIFILVMVLVTEYNRNQ